MFPRFILRIYNLLRPKDYCKRCGMELPPRNAGFCKEHLKDVIAEINAKMWDFM